MQVEPKIGSNPNIPAGPMSLSHPPPPPPPPGMGQMGGMDILNP